MQFISDTYDTYDMQFISCSFLDCFQQKQINHKFEGAIYQWYFSDAKNSSFLSFDQWSMFFVATSARYQFPSPAPKRRQGERNMF